MNNTLLAIGLIACLVNTVIAFSENDWFAGGGWLTAASFAGALLAK